MTVTRQSNADSVRVEVIFSDSPYSVVNMGWLPLVGSLKLFVSFAKEPYKRDYILQKRPVILRSLLIVTLFSGRALSLRFRVALSIWGGYH